ncbi:SGNH/GDSL hydrolase family protein [Amycolatopsis acidiphila]|uniref:SGNH/GDSL hydrolase family protein n=1 Tax=Amycolatopsis acidiphila TaxID=715473 RepID=A0A557ZNX1_9PSEU|nr:SGNH/GDSL hydrolase family protein [Amycolatopsis acidiphila]TVT13680.1 SGNH/GDSL hydrolase family protein [Amycolatopsis acidiphila]UIJ59085.1 SGNH/GDSL hydrolase family protein [Amycolatopsis acidiphila]GHG95887.1 SGNH hydrolase [Amycolatopsis acidiphila]
MQYERFIALGDSCTEGLHDPYPGSTQYRGWADLAAATLAALNPQLRYANLGVRGRRLDQIIVEQIPTALDLQPDLVALFGGANDVMTRHFRPEVVAKRVDAAVRILTRSAPSVVVFTLSDVSSRIPGVLRVRHRIDALNESIRAAAGQYGAMLVDLADEDVHDLRYFGPDRLHLSEPGHRRLAAHLLTRLGVSSDPAWLAPLPGEPLQPGLRAHAQWMWQEVLPVALTRTRNWFVGRSPGDGFAPKRPELLPVLDELNPWTAIPGGA